MIPKDIEAWTSWLNISTFKETEDINLLCSFVTHYNHDLIMCQVTSHAGEYIYTAVPKDLAP